MMEQVKEKVRAFEDMNKWWVYKNHWNKWYVRPPIEKIHHLELRGEFTRHDAALAFAIAESHQ